MDYYLLSDQDLDEIVWGIEDVLRLVEEKFKKNLICEDEIEKDIEGD